MKKVILPVVMFLVAIVCACILVLQPLRLVSNDNTRLTVHVGKTVPIIAIAELSGGYRCYVNDDEYFWLSASDCTQEVGEELCVKFRLNEPATIYRGEI